MAIFSVDSDAVSQATATTRAASERVRGDISTIVATLAQLDAQWSGGASSAFQSSLQTWRATQLTVEQALEDLHAALAHAARAYDDTEMAAMSMFR